MQTEKLTFDDGSWWEIRTVHTVGMARRTEELLKPYIKPSNADKVVSGEEKELKFKVSMEEINVFEVQRALVFAATVAWSYGPLTLEIYENEVPQKNYEVVSRRCDELFGSGPLPVRSEKKSRKPFSRLLSLLTRGNSQ